MGKEDMLNKIFYIKRHGMNKIFCIFGIKIKIPIKNACCCFADYEMLCRQNVDFPHPIGIVIATNGEIGKNCVIYQNVTIGTKSKAVEKDINSYPKIGDNVIIYAGACVVGGIKIGNNVIIGANTVVTTDVPDNSLVVGNPARILPRKKY